MQSVRGENYLGWIRLVANGRRALPRLDMPRSQWAASISWAGYVSQPMGGEHYLGCMRLAANGRRALPGPDASRSQWATSITWAG
jgi:hypothetical protein